MWSGCECIIGCGRGGTRDECRRDCPANGNRPSNGVLPQLSHAMLVILQVIAIAERERDICLWGLGGSRGLDGSSGHSNSAGLGGNSGRASSIGLGGGFEQGGGKPLPYVLDAGQGLQVA